MGPSANISQDPRALLEEGRFAFCPECGRVLGDGDPRDHFLREHGYVDLAGIVMPPAAALTCWWDRVFTTGDVQAHDRVCQLLAAGPVPQTGQSPYSVALDAQLLHHTYDLASNEIAQFSHLPPY